jgi:hypothetical protein
MVTIEITPKQNFWIQLESGDTMSEKLQKIIERYDWMVHEIERLRSYKEGLYKAGVEKE